MVALIHQPFHLETTAQRRSKIEGTADMDEFDRIARLL